jgi:hypothetical protein
MAWPTAKNSIQGRNARKPVRIPGPWVMKQREEAEKEMDCPNCGEVCPFQRADFRVIQNPVPFQKASDACARHGWLLADLTTGETPDAALLILQCAFPILSGQAWIRSFDGVGGGRCMLVQAPPNAGLQVFWVYRECSTEERFVLCRTNDYSKRIPAPTCEGGWVGERSTVTLPTRNTTTTICTVFSTTSTITRTVCKCGQFGCDPDCWDSAWDDSFDEPDRQDMLP